MHIRSIGACALAVLLCSCAATSVKKTWKSPDYHGRAISKVAVLAIDERGDVRQGFENRLAGQMRNLGATVTTTYDLFSLPEINADKKAAAERLRSAGVEAIIIMKLVSSSSFYRESRPGNERYAEVITGYQPDYWYGYFSVAYADMSPTYGNLKQNVYLETSLFDLATAKRLWSGITLTSVKETTDRVGEMDPLVAKVVAAMRKDGMIP